MADVLAIGGTIPHKFSSYPRAFSMIYPGTGSFTVAAVDFDFINLDNYLDENTKEKMLPRKLRRVILSGGSFDFLFGSTLTASKYLLSILITDS